MQSRFEIRSLVISIFILSLSLISCSQNTDANRLGAAQLCIDNASQGQAENCVQSISDIQTSAASLLRCSAGFIDEGFTQTTRFDNAFTALSQSGGNSTGTFLSIMAFSSQSTQTANQTFVDSTYTNCIQSNSKGYMLLASMAKTATTLAGIAGSFTNGTQPTASQILSAIGTNYTDPTTQTAVGSAIIATYQASCQTGSQANTTICTQLTSAMNSGSIDTSNPQQVGQAILTYWYNNP